MHYDIIGVKPVKPVKPCYNSTWLNINEITPTKGKRQKAMTSSALMFSFAKNVV